MPLSRLIRRGHTFANATVCFGTDTMRDRDKAWGYACLFSFLLAFCAPGSGMAMTLTLQQVLAPTDFGRTIDSVAIPGAPNKQLLLNQQTGAIGVYDSSDNSVTPFLPAMEIDGSTLPTSGNVGAYSLALAPDFSTSGKFYVSAAIVDQNVLVEYTANPTLLTVDPTTQRRVMTIDHPSDGTTASNHYGSAISFDADGMLLMTTGDSDAPFAPGTLNPSQDVTDRLGAVLRINPNGDDFGSDPLNNYAVPSDNPDFGPGSAPELYAIGLRNPLKGKFDPVTGHFLVADVGEDNREEISVVTAGANLGWPGLEGTLALGGDLSLAGILTDPLYEYQHGTGPFEGISVTGGLIYHGSLGLLDGRYVFSDFGPFPTTGTAPLWSFAFDVSTMTISELTKWTLLFDGGGSFDHALGFGQDGNGGLYLFDFDGDVFAVTPAVVPIPAAFPLFATAIAAIGFFGWRRRTLAEAA